MKEAFSGGCSAPSKPSHGVSKPSPSLEGMLRNWSLLPLACGTDRHHGHFWRRKEGGKEAGRQGGREAGRGHEGRGGEGRAGQGRAGQGRAGQGRAGQGRAGQGRAGQGRAGQGRGEGRGGEGRGGEGGQLNKVMQKDEERRKGCRALVKVHEKQC